MASGGTHARRPGGQPVGVASQFQSLPLWIIASSVVGAILLWTQRNNAFPRSWWWYVPAGLRIALLGAALSLIDLGIDEHVNPRLRSAGGHASAMRRRGRSLSAAVTQVRPSPAPMAETTSTGDRE